VRIIFIIALALIALIYFIISQIKKPFSFKERDAKDDFNSLMFHAGQAIKYLVIIFVWGIRFVFDTLKETFKWLKHKDKEEDNGKGKG
jgi:hypothetical protein